MIVVAVILTFHESTCVSMIEASNRVAEITRTEAGCISYEFFADINQPGRMLLFEEWESRDALDAHLASPHLAEFRAFLADADVTRDLRRYEVTDEF